MHDIFASIIILAFLSTAAGMINGTAGASDDAHPTVQMRGPIPQQQQQQDEERLSNLHNPSEEASAIVQKNVDEDIAKEYLIQSAIKFSDGGEVMFEQEYQLGDTLYPKNAKVPIETVLRLANYVKRDRNDDAKEAKSKTVLIFVHGCPQLRKRKACVLHNGRGACHGGTIRAVPKSTEYPEGLKEEARFHFNGDGLNLYKKWFKDEEKTKPGTNFVVKHDAHMTEVKQPIRTERKRGIYVKDGFLGGDLHTKQLSITEMKEISLKIIGGRKWGGDFRCRHFAYNFVRSIVPEKKLAELSSSVEKWPKSLQVLDKYFEEHIDGTNAFSICHNFDFNDWVKNHLDKDGKVKKVKVTKASKGKPRKNTQDRNQPKLPQEDAVSRNSG